MIIARLVDWRDMIARQEDESLEFVLPSRGILKLAKSQPKTEQSLLAELEQIKGASFLSMRLSEILAIFNIPFSQKKSKNEEITSSSLNGSSKSYFDHTGTPLMKQDEFYVGVNNFSGCFQLDNLQLQAQNNNLNDENMPRLAPSKLEDGLLRYYDVERHEEKLLELKRKIIDQERQELKERMKSIEDVSKKVNEILQKTFTLQSEKESEAEPQSISERFGKNKSKKPRLMEADFEEYEQETETAEETIPKSHFTFTEEMALEAGVIPQSNAPAKSSLRDPPKPEKSKVKRNPYLLKPTRNKGASSISYVPK